MPDNPLVIIFVVSITLIAIYMAIEGFVLVYNGLVRLTNKRTKTLPVHAPSTAPDAPDAPDAPTLLASIASAKPHLLVVGHTGGGKSVAVRAFAKHVTEEGASVVALDPDAAPRHYPKDVQLISDDEQWGAAIAAIAALFQERNDAYRSGTERFDAAWIIADECQELLAIDGALETIERVIRRGRKLNMHVCLAVQDSQVKTLGIEGKSALLANLSRVELMKRGNSRIATVDGVEYSVPDLPTHYDGASGDWLALDVVATPHWTEKHQFTANILAAEPDVSGRELARRLYGGDGSGEAFYLAKKIREEVSNWERT